MHAADDVAAVVVADVTVAAVVTAVVAGAAEVATVVGVAKDGLLTGCCMAEVVAGPATCPGGCTPRTTSLGVGGAAGVPTPTHTHLATDQTPTCPDHSSPDHAPKAAWPTAPEVTAALTPGTTPASVVSPPTARAVLPAAFPPLCTKCRTASQDTTVASIPRHVWTKLEHTKQEEKEVWLKYPS